mgnify:CR=1 FL=1
MLRLTKDDTHPVRFTLNGRPVSVRVAPRTLLTDTLRHAIGATGTHVGCEHGVCGACTVQVNGEPVRACLMLAQQAQGCDIRTVEALAEGPDLSPLQAAFREHFALQCGFCTPGFVVACTAVLTKNPDATLEEAQAGCGGNLCRCGTYVGMNQALMDAAKSLKGGA